MNHGSTVSLALGAALLAASSWAGSSGNRPDVDESKTREGIAWTGNYHGALTAAKEEGKPVLLRVEPLHCQPCRDMERRVWSDARVTELARSFVMVRLDSGVYDYLYHRWRIREVPTLIILDSSGTEIERLRGYAHAQTLVKSMSSVLEELAKP